jgi:radical SAM protein with 4Fe4S-binding SPASM domain
VIFTGGDPLKRDDLFDLIAAARERGLGVSVSPSATPLLTGDTIRRLRASGVEAISLSLDAATAERHDALRGVPGCFDRTLQAARVASEVGLPFQINTLACEETVDDMPAIHAFARELRAARWSVFFLVQVGRGTVLRPLSPERSESLLEWLAIQADTPGLVVTTTEAPQYRRVLMRHRAGGASTIREHGRGVRDGNGVMFISHDGEILPSGFLPLSAGNVRTDDPLTVYRTSPVFQTLRAVDDFTGRCGVCEFRSACGGSRARAFAASGDPFDEDPLCTHRPALQMRTPPA